MALYISDPRNCSRYRDCAASGQEGTLRECPGTSIFDTTVKLCRQRRSSSECPIFNCNQKFNEFIVYQPNPAYYAFCVTPPTRQVRIRVFKCRDDLNYVFDLNTKQCEYRCKALGRFTDREDCEGYILCGRNQRGQVVYDRVKCPNSYYFSNGQCLPYQTSTAPKCVPEIPPPQPPPAGNGGNGNQGSRI